MQTKESAEKIITQKSVLQFHWGIRLKLWAESDKLRAEGDKLWAEIDKLRAEGDKLRAEGDKLLAESDKLRAEGDKLLAEGDKLRAESDKLRAEGDKLWAECILEFVGNVKLEWKWIESKNGSSCEVEGVGLFEP